MTTTILPQPVPAVASVDNHLATVDRARDYADASRAPSTRRGYASGWRDFSRYCLANGLVPVPATPQTVVLYVTNLAQKSKLATVKQRVVAISQYHKERGLESPTSDEMVRRVLQGIARTNGSAQRKKAALTLDHLRAMLLEIRGEGLKAARARTIVLLGFSAALRRSELAVIDVNDVIFCKEGLRLIIRRSKTDQTGEGVEIAVRYVKNQSLCADRAVKAWLDAAGITSGPVFRTFSLQRQLTDRAIDGRDVANLVQKLARRAHLEGDFAAHSLRAGFVTVAARSKVSLDAIARTTRHKSLTVLMGYVRPAQAFDDVALTSMIA